VHLVGFTIEMYYDARLASKQTAVSVWLLYVQSCTPDDGRKDRPKHVECHSKIKYFDTLVHLVGFTIEMYIGLHVKYSCSCQNLIKLQFSTRTQIPKFMKIRLLGSKLFHAKRRTDRHDEPSSLLPQF